jgi:hypothetical protein
MRSERGIALLVALVVAILLSLLGLSLTFSSMNEMAISSEFENHERALLVADGGFNAVKGLLKGVSVDQKLAATTLVPVYISETTPAPGGWAWRNPISPLTARNINFNAPPAGVNRTVSGMLTPASGVVLGTGRYWAKLSDNSEADNDYRVDSDGTVYLRVIGIHQSTLAQTTTSYGTNRKNAVAILEAQLRRDSTFKMSSPLSVVAPSVTATFNGTSFKIDGYDHSGIARSDLPSHKDKDLVPYSAISCLYQNGSADAQPLVETITAALPDTKKETVIGLGNPSVNDDTEETWNSDNPDARNVFDPVFLKSVVSRLKAVADNYYSSGADLDGNALGTPSDPKITVVEGNLKVAGNTSGAGLLVVTGKFEMNGTFKYDGLILVIGQGDYEMGGTNKGAILGGMIVANVNGGAFGEAAIRMNGNSDFFFAGDRISMALDLLPMRVLSWREITPDIEPDVQLLVGSTLQ